MTRGLKSTSCKILQFLVKYAIPDRSICPIEKKLMMDIVQRADFETSVHSTAENQIRRKVTYGHNYFTLLKSKSLKHL